MHMPEKYSLINKELICRIRGRVNRVDIDPACGRENDVVFVQGRSCQAATVGRSSDLACQAEDSGSLHAGQHRGDQQCCKRSEVERIACFHDGSCRSRLRRRHQQRVCQLRGSNEFTGLRGGPRRAVRGVDTFCRMAHLRPAGRPAPAAGETESRVPKYGRRCCDAGRRPALRRPPRRNPHRTRWAENGIVICCRSSAEHADEDGAARVRGGLRQRLGPINGQPSPATRVPVTDYSPAR